MDIKLFLVIFSTIFIIEVNTQLMGGMGIKMMPMGMTSGGVGMSSGGMGMTSGGIGMTSGSLGMSRIKMVGSSTGMGSMGSMGRTGMGMTRMSNVGLMAGVGKMMGKIFIFLYKFFLNVL